MKKLKYVALLLALATTFSACKKEDDEITLTPDGEVAIDNNLVGVWKVNYNDYNGSEDGTIGEITLTITASGTIISENVCTVYDHSTDWKGESTVDEENDYQMLKFETSSIASNRIKIGGEPYYWSVYQMDDEDGDEMTYLDITDAYNTTNGSFAESGWEGGSIFYQIFPNTEFVKQ
tara:strand:- start:755 stop:1285 length:531 start_codon:yes stop_codon:yes gene_type:complete